MNKFMPLFLFLQFALLQLSGCSIARYSTGDISKNSKVVHLNINDIQDLKSFPFYELELGYKDEKLKVNFEQADRNSKIENFIKKIKANVKTGTKVDIAVTYVVKPSIREIDTGDNKTFSVKYHRCMIHSAPQVYIPVEFPNGRKYIAYLDTGFNSIIILTSDIVVDNNLVVIPICGACQIPILNIGQAQIKDATVFYDEQQWQFRVLNIPLYKHSAIILGRDFIKSFGYVMFDNVKKEVVFSKNGTFLPEYPHLWISYPFIEDPNAGNTIMVKIPINGNILDIAFDSCGGDPGLVLNKSHWQAIKNDLNIKKLVNSNITIWAGDHWPCKKATVSKISIGEKIIKNAEVNIDENPEHLSIFSLGYFQDSVVVLDFVNNLLWIKK